MKPTVSSISLALFILTTTLSLHTTTSTIIYDSTGLYLLRGITYHILPLLRGSGGGLTITRATKDACPLDVTQEPFEVNHGVPFTFNPIILDDNIIREAYPISIEADLLNPCTESNILHVKDKVNDHKKKKKDHDDDDDDDDKKHVSFQSVTTGGVFNKPESCFQIVEVNMMPGLKSYQIQNCPFKCGSTSTSLVCYNVGVIVDADGKGYLGRTDAIFPVVFTNSFSSLSELAKPTTFSQ